MEDYLTFLSKWKTTSNFLKMEDDLNFFENGRKPHFFLMEDNLNFFENGRQPHFFENGRRPQLLGEWKTTTKIQMENDLKFWGNGRRPKKFKWKMSSIFFFKWKTTSIMFFKWTTSSKKT